MRGQGVNDVSPTEKDSIRLCYPLEKLAAKTFPEPNSGCHLFTGTLRKKEGYGNVLRGLTITGINARKTACHRGHPFNAENTYIGQRRGKPTRSCRACHRIKAARYLNKRSALAATQPIAKEES
jgi:hypothetical protein